MADIDPRNFLYMSKYKIDQVLGTYDSDDDEINPDISTVVIGASSQTTFEFPHHLGDNALFAGGFKIDNSSILSQFGMKYFTNPAATSVIDRGVTVFCKCTKDKFKFYASNSDNVNSHTIHFQVAALAKPNQGEVTPQKVSNDVIFNTSLNYAKIAYEESRPVTFPAQAAPGAGYRKESFTIPLPPEIRYIPFMRVFTEFSDEIYMHGASVFNPPAAFSIYTSPSADSDDVTIDLINGSSSEPTRTGIVHTRIYYDS